MSIIKLPFRIARKVAKKGYLGLHQLYYSVAPYKVQCNICGYKANQLKSDSWHEFSICPNCVSSMRHRLLWASLNLLDEVNIKKLITGKKVLYFAPDPVLDSKVKAFAASYETADFWAEGYHYSNIDHNLDISDMSRFADNTYDCIIAFDVLEHVPAHLKAIEEINRVLKPGGYAILSVPQQDNLAKTEEDLSPMSREEREKRFGQWDHLRIYGDDFNEMLTARGFRVRIVTEKDFSPETVAKHVLFPPVLSKHPMATNYRRIYFSKKV